MSRLTIAAGALGAAAIVGVPLGIAAASPGSNDSATRRSDTTITHHENGDRRSDLKVERVRSRENEKDAQRRKAARHRKDLKRRKAAQHRKDVQHLNETLWVNKVKANQHLKDVQHLNEAIWANKVKAASALKAAADAQATEQANAAAANAAAANAAAASASSSSASTSSRASAYQAPVQGNGRCGGNLPPCYVMQRESGGSLTAKNPSSTAAGKWQFLDSTWNGYGGYASASQAPESVQDARAAEVWANGSGCSAWSAC